MQEIKEHFSEEAYRKFLEDADDGVENEMLMKIQMPKTFPDFDFEGDRMLLLNTEASQDQV